MSRVSADKGLAKGCLVPRIQSSADLSKANENLVLTHEATIEYSSFRLFANIDDSCLKNNGHSGAIRPEEPNINGVKVAFSVVITLSL